MKHNTFKKILVAGLGVLAAASLFSFGNQPEQVQAAKKSSSSLVIYFSKTGNTARAAKQIQRETGAKILRINDLKYLSKENVQSSFNDILADFFKKNKVLFSSNIEIANSDGISSHFDFSVPSNDKKEKLLKTVGRPNDVNQAKIFNYDVKATSLVRDADYILVLDDKNYKTNIEQDTINTALIGLENINAQVIGSRELMLSV